MMLVSSSSNFQKTAKNKRFMLKLISYQGRLCMSKICKGKAALKCREKLYFDGFPQEVDSYNDEVFQLISDRCNRLNLIIEIGCGSGVWTAHLAKLGKHVVGLDLSSILIKKLHKRLKKLNCEAVIGDAEFLPFTDKVADCCFFFYSLHHIPDISQAINEATRCLKDNGQLVLVEPNGLNFMLALIARITFILRLVNKAGMTSPAERPLNIKKIVQILSEVGFDCNVLPCYATLRKKSQAANLSFPTRIYTLFLKFAASFFPKFFGASDFILFAKGVKGKRIQN